MKIKAFVATAALMFFIYGCSESNSWSNKKFSKEDWKSSTANGRYFYTKDLIEKKILINLNKKEVADLLGRPDFTSDNPASMQYLIKTGGEGFDQVQILDIRFEHGKVTRVFTRGD